MLLWMERDKYFPSLLYNICKGIICFFSSETLKKICPMVRKKPYLSPLLKNGHSMGKFWLLHANIALQWTTMITCERTLP